MLKYIAFAFALTTACTTADTSSADRAIIPTACAADTECPTGFECEIEVEHGTTTSFCQAHDSGGACPDGYELEVEHGQTFCKPHGGDDNGGGSGGGGTACTTDAECGVGLECELEHGAGFCKPHGGN